MEINQNSFGLAYTQPSFSNEVSSYFSRLRARASQIVSSPLRSSSNNLVERNIGIRTSMMLPSSSHEERPPSPPQEESQDVGR